MRGETAFIVVLAVVTLEHASLCKTVAEFGRQHLGLEYHWQTDKRRLQFLLLEPGAYLNDHRLVMGALRVTAAYRVHCRLRRQIRDGFSREFIMRALAHAAKEAVIGHHIATIFYDARFIN